MENLMAIISLEIPQGLCEPLKAVGNKVLGANDVSLSIVDNPEQSHISLYVGIFPEYNKEKVLGVVQEVALETEEITTRPTGLNEKSRFVAIEFENSSSIQSLHETLVRKLNPLREGLIKDKYSNPETLNKLTSEEKNNLEKWGYPYGMNCYSPHLTLGRFENQNQAISAIQQDAGLDVLKSFTFDKIEVVFLQDEHDRENREKFTYYLRK